MLENEELLRKQLMHMQGKQDTVTAEEAALREAQRVLGEAEDSFRHLIEHAVGEAIRAWMTSHPGFLPTCRIHLTPVQRYGGLPNHVVARASEIKFTDFTQKQHVPGCKTQIE